MSIKPTQLTEALYQYLLDVSLREPSVLAELRQKTLSLSQGSMMIPPDQGQFMSLLIKLMRAKKTLDIGVFTGYSATVVALALPEDGKVIACDNNDEWTKIAKATWEKAGVANKIDFHLGSAIDTLQQLIDQGESGTFDFAFIDADKKNYPNYYELCLKLIRPGGLIAVDNTLGHGSLVDLSSLKPYQKAIAEFNQMIYQDDRVDISIVPIGDGLTLLCRQS